MSRKEILDRITFEKIVAIIRLSSSVHVYDTALALSDGGVNVVEVTLGTPNALEEIQKLSQHSEILIGAGSVLNRKMAVEAVDAGAQYIVTPTTKKEVIEAAHDLDKPILSGAFTPTEVLQAYDYGADIIKLFPAEALGISYFSSIKAPMPHIPIMPTGGINVQNARAWVDKGAVCLGVGSALVNKSLIASGDFDAITEQAVLMKAAIN